MGGRLIIKGTLLTHGQGFYVGNELFGSFLLSVINSWYYSNYSSSGEIKVNIDSQKNREYGKIKSALYGYTDDLNNISINYCLLKETIENKEINVHKANLYVALILENLFTNIRSLYDFLFHFIKISLSDSQLKSYPQTDSLNKLISFAKNPNNEEKLPKNIIQFLNKIEADLTDIRLIRDNIVHKGKEIRLTRKNEGLFMRLPKEGIHSQDNILPNILNSQEIDYHVKKYLKKIIKSTFTNLEILGVIIYNEIANNESYQFNLYSITNYCMEDFNDFLIQ